CTGAMPCRGGGPLEWGQRSNATRGDHRTSTVVSTQRRCRQHCGCRRGEHGDFWEQIGVSMNYKCSFCCASGPNLKACGFIGFRSDPRVDSDIEGMESWAVIALGSKVEAPLHVPGRLTGTWYSSRGDLYLSSFSGEVFRVLAVA